MPRPPSKNTRQTAVRFDPDLLRRIDALMPKLVRPGVGICRTEALRVALLLGVEMLEKELGVAVKKPTAKKPKRKTS